jgi:hypothetical protein
MVVWSIILEAGYETNIKRFRVGGFLGELMDSHPSHRAGSDLMYPTASCQMHFLSETNYSFRRSQRASQSS